MTHPELIPTVSRLFAHVPDPEDCNPAAVPANPANCLWFIRIPQTAAVDVPETWDAVIHIVSTWTSWVSHPILGVDEQGCPELHLAIAPSEREAILDCVEAVEAQTGLHTFYEPTVTAYWTERRNTTHVDGGVIRIMPEVWADAKEILSGGPK